MLKAPSLSLDRSDTGIETDLCNAILREMLLAIGRAPDGMARRLLEPFLHLPARRFARLMASVDSRAGEAGITAAAQWLLPHPHGQPRLIYAHRSIATCAPPAS